MARAPRQLPPEREEMLLSIARDVFLDKGVGNSTIDLIAARSGISKATIYRRYKNKEEIFETIMLKAAERMNIEMGNFSLDYDDPVDSLRSAAWAIRKAVIANVEILRLQIAELPRHLEVCQQSRDRMNSILMAKLLKYFEELLNRGQMDHTHIMSAASTFLLMAAGGFRAHFRAIESDELEWERMEADLSILIRGCGIRPPNKK